MFMHVSSLGGTVSSVGWGHCQCLFMSAQGVGAQSGDMHVSSAGEKVSCEDMFISDGDGVTT
jgi:hypothetical protein